MMPIADANSISHNTNVLVAPPRNVSAIVESPTAMRVTWEPSLSTTGVDGYVVYLKPAGTPESAYQQVSVVYGQVANPESTIPINPGETYDIFVQTLASATDANGDLLTSRTNCEDQNCKLEAITPISTENEAAQSTGGRRYYYQSPKPTAHIEIKNEGAEPPPSSTPIENTQNIVTNESATQPSQESDTPQSSDSGQTKTRQEVTSTMPTEPATPLTKTNLSDAFTSLTFHAAAISNLGISFMFKHGVLAILVLNFFVLLYELKKHAGLNNL